jgi:hypothetical protein
MKVSLNRVQAVSVVLLAVGLITLWSTNHSAFGRGDDTAKITGPAHFTVVMTEGHNLLVTDNATNKLYFYTTDKDKPIGTPLKLRASISLNDVGQEEIRITAHNLEKPEK